MRRIARQSARLATLNQPRQSSTPCQHVTAQQRTFSVTKQRSSEPRSPNGQPDHHASSNELRESPRESANDSHNEEQKNGEGNVEGNGEGTYVNDGRKSSVRRSFRSRRMNDVPRPPPIPQWFLDQNVRLFEESAEVDGHEREYQSGGHDIQCVDAETGHILFTLPYFRPLLKRRPVKKMFNMASKQQKYEDVSEEAKTTDLPESEQMTMQTTNEVKDGSGLDPFDHKFHEPNKGESGQSLSANNALDTTDSTARTERRFARMKASVDAYTPMRWLYLEAVASIHAALSLANVNRQSFSIAADRVDLSLQCLDPDSHNQMDDFVDDLAGTVKADLIRLDANDFAELSSDYVGQGDDGPGSFSNLGYEVFDGYQTSALDPHSNPFRPMTEQDEDNDMEDEEDEDEDERNHSQGIELGPLANSALRQLGFLRSARHREMRVLGVKLSMPQSNQLLPTRHTSSKSSATSPSAMNRDDARLDALLDTLLDASLQKRSTTVQQVADSKKSKAQRSMTMEEARVYQRSLMLDHTWLPEAERLMLRHLVNNGQHTNSDSSSFKFIVDPKLSLGDYKSPLGQNRRTIIHVRDLQDICTSRLGDTIIKRLVKAVRKRRRSGEQVLIVGTTAQDVPGPIRITDDHSDDMPFLPLIVPPFFKYSRQEERDFRSSFDKMAQKPLDPPAYRRILEINLRHIQTMVRRLRPNDDIDITSAEAQKLLNVPGMYFLTEKVLSMDRIQALALVAIGLWQTYAEAETIRPIHITLAALIVVKNHQIVHEWSKSRDKQRLKQSKSNSDDKHGKDKHEDGSDEARKDKLRKSCNTHETRLLSGMINPENIKTRFEDVHAPSETLDALKTLTSLSLLRPDAFNYGVLANDRLPGLLLYGPPGTGKTLLAKAVAKESKATVLEVSGAQIYEKYVGEGEKMVRAVFSLAKKLSPCIVFIDEADAIFGSRSNVGERNTHREIINQFLREWDGMDDHGVFMMVASNRPFDLDDAVLRRLPRRLLVDLPVTKDRESILGIHLRNEKIDSSVSLSKLAEQTPLYSGSDLKNLSVAAALAAVREENELAESQQHDKDFKLPDQRTLTSKHFERAMAEISASISEDMSSLGAIRKFDERYGDRRGRRKKTAYGFGATDTGVDENAARVRQSSPPPL